MEEETTPKELMVRALNDMFRQLKQVKPGVKTVSVISDYDENRFDPDEAEDIADHTDMLVINEEVKDLQRFLRALAKIERIQTKKSFVSLEN